MYSPLTAAVGLSADSTPFTYKSPTDFKPEDFNDPKTPAGRLRIAMQALAEVKAEIDNLNQVFNSLQALESNDEELEAFLAEQAAKTGRHPDDIAKSLPNVKVVQARLIELNAIYTSAVNELAKNQSEYLNKMEGAVSILVSQVTSALIAAIIKVDPAKAKAMGIHTPAGKAAFTHAVVARIMDSSEAGEAAKAEALKELYASDPAGVAALATAESHDNTETHDDLEHAAEESETHEEKAELEAAEEKAETHDEDAELKAAIAKPLSTTPAFVDVHNAGHRAAQNLEVSLYMSMTAGGISKGDARTIVKRPEVRSATADLEQLINLFAKGHGSQVDTIMAQLAHAMGGSASININAPIFAALLGYKPSTGQNNQKDLENQDQYYRMGSSY